MTRRESKRSSGSSWDARQERGSRLALRFVVWAIRSLGYYRLRVLLAPISVYYCLFAGPARRASREYLAKIAVAQGRPRRIGLRDIYRHIYTFAEVILDRVSLWCESLEGFHVEIHGREHMESLVENRSGAFLIGAHIGSFDVLRVAVLCFAGSSSEKCFEVPNSSTVNEIANSSMCFEQVRLREAPRRRPAWGSAGSDSEG